MRIISGTCRGRSITTPANLKARPTTDFAKENLFNVLNNRYNFGSLRVLDLFSGTGSISYEFASRGAVKVVSVEMNALHNKFIRGNATQLGLDTIIPLRANAFTYIKTCHDRFDLIFADPPYDLPEIDLLIEAVFKHNLLTEEGCLILEHSKNKDYSTHPLFVENRKYGSVNFSFFEQSNL